MNKKDSLRALCYRLRASHGRALNYEYILPVESGGEENDGIPQEDWVMLITIQGPLKSGGGGVHEKRRVRTEPR